MTKRKPLGAVMAYRQVLNELKAAENNAILRNKPTMHAYLADIVRRTRGRQTRDRR